MKFNEAVKILNYEDYEKSTTQEESLEAIRVFWRLLKMIIFSHNEDIAEKIRQALLSL